MPVQTHFLVVFVSAVFSKAASDTVVPGNSLWNYKGSEKDV
jgi:hypothetical protein